MFKLATVGAVGIVEVSPQVAAGVTGWIAQLVEQRTENPRVAGSIPAPATPLIASRVFPLFILEKRSK
jgi:hypothetical protein